MTVIETPAGVRTAPPASLAAREVPFTDIPVIDFEPLLGQDEAARRATAAAMREAAVEVGFFYISNHGVAQERVAALFEQAQAFFGLPLEDKLAIHVKAMGFDIGGYTPLLQENTDAAGQGDVHESYDMVRGVPATGGEPQGRHPWPRNLPAFQATMEAYETAMLALGRRLFGAFAIALDLPEDHFEAMIADPTRELRVLHYPSQDETVREVQIGIGAHTDYECFTILAQDDVPALQVRNSAGEWIAAPPIPGAFLVNIGDQLQRWSNDLFRSTVHRAVNLTGRSRYSIPYFLGVDYHTQIDVLPHCVSADRPRRYEPVIAGEYLLGRIAATYSAPLADV